MFDIGFTEVTLIAVIGLLVIGPERLPRVAREVGLWVGRIRRYVTQVRADIEREVRAEELRELVKKPVDELKEAIKDTEKTIKDTEKTIRVEEKKLEKDLNAGDDSSKINPPSSGTEAKRGAAASAPTTDAGAEPGAPNTPDAGASDAAGSGTDSESPAGDTTKEGEKGDTPVDLAADESAESQPQSAGESVESDDAARATK